MNENYQSLLAAIAAVCKCSTIEAEGHLNGSIQYLQELKLENDFRTRDLADECEGLLLTRYNKLYFDYATEQLRDENIPQNLKDSHYHEDDNGNPIEGDYFNPFEWSGLLGEDVMEEVINMIY